MEISDTKVGLVFKSCDAFWRAHPDLWERFREIVTDKSKRKISGRVVEHFVVHHSKKHNTAYSFEGKAVIVHNRYHDAMRTPRKRIFDPFCRGKSKIMYTPFPELADPPIQTSVGQLNFFKWAFENGVIDYVEAHHEEIHADMDAYNRETAGRTRRKKTRGSEEEDDAPPAAGAGAGAGGGAVTRHVLETVVRFGATS